jgi:hypothetical protein
MTSDQDRTPLHRETDVEQLMTTLDDLNSGRQPSAAELDPELLSLAKRLHAETCSIPERPGFREALRENLMLRSTTDMPIAAALPLRQGTDSGGRERRSSPRMVPPVLRHTSTWLGAIAATLLIVLATALGGFLAIRDLSGEREPGTHVAAPLAGTPAGDEFQVPPDDPRWTCTRPDPFIPCLEASRPIGSAGLEVPIDDALLAVRHVQLQDWRVDPGTTATLSASESGPGVVLDFVLDGTYAATFDVDVIAYRTGVPNGYVHERIAVPAGSVVELGKGDAVGFPVGTAQLLHNPLAQTPLRFKRAVFADESQAAIPSAVDATSSAEPGNKTVSGSGWTMMVDGDNTMAEPLGAILPNVAGMTGNVFDLVYVQVPEGATFPPQRAGMVAIGPVAPEPSEVTGTAGYVLWVHDIKG